MRRRRAGSVRGLAEAVGGTGHHRQLRLLDDRSRGVGDFVEALAKRRKNVRRSRRSSSRRYGDVLTSGLPGRRSGVSRRICRKPLSGHERDAFASRGVVKSASDQIESDLRRARRSEHEELISLCLAFGLRTSWSQRLVPLIARQADGALRAEVHGRATGSRTEQRCARSAEGVFAPTSGRRIRPTACLRTRCDAL